MGTGASCSQLGVWEGQLCKSNGVFKHHYACLPSKEVQLC
jgi:hypothetical protein